MKRRGRHPWSVVVALLAATAACSQGENGRLAALQTERRALHLQFLSVQNSIRAAQARALEEPGVIAAQAAFYQTIREVIERDDPEGARLLDRATAVGHDIERLSGPVVLAPGQRSAEGRSEEKQEAVEELAAVERELRPLIDRAFRDPLVAQSFSALQDSVIAALVRADPGAEAILDRMRELERQIGVIDARIREVSG